MKGLSYIRFVPIAMFLFFLLSNITTLAVVSPANQFNITPSPLLVNWTVGTANITSNTGNLTINISNASTGISGNFSQAIRWSIGEYPAFTTAMQSTCFDNMDVKTAEGGTSYRNTTASQIQPGNSTNFTVEAYSACPPGRYEGTLSFFNSTNSSESLAIYTIVNIPISSSNTFNTSFNNASFKGKAVAGTLVAQSFFFNTSIAANLTGFSIALTGMGSDIDIFLLDQTGTTVAKSINTSSGDEELVYQNFVSVPAGRIWEIRVFGNVTSNYTGSLQASILNFTNSTDTLASTSTVNYGQFDQNSSAGINFTIENEHSNKVNVSQTKIEVYRLERANDSATRNFTIIVPGFAVKVEAEIAWQPTGLQTDWNLAMYDKSTQLISSSSTKLDISNVTNTTRFERVVYTAVNSTNEGFWTISVFNQTSGSNPYNLTVKIYMPPSLWLNTNYGPAYEFNFTGGINSTKNVTANLTIPAVNVTNGTYEAKITYSGTAKNHLTATFSVRAGTLLINNTLSSSSEINLTENIGYNRSLVLNISYNNTGDYPIYWTNLTSTALYLGTNSSRFANFSVVVWPPNPIPAGSGGRFTVNITVNVNNTVNSQGIYSGWIFFNTSNTTSNSSSYPYQTHNLTINLNLTDQLLFRNVTFTTFAFINGSRDHNMTVNFTVLLQNGTVISTDSQFNLSNIQEVFIMDRAYNYTKLISHYTNISSPACGSALASCRINLTVPAFTVGGLYQPNINVTFTTPDGTILRTTVSNTTATQEVNNTGLKVYESTSVALSNINEATGTSNFNITVVNGGGTSAYGLRVTFDTNSCTAITVTANNSDCLINSTDGATFIFNNLTQYTGACGLRWNITANNVSSTTTCSGMRITTSNLSYNNLTGISITVVDVSSASGTSSSGSGGSGSGSGAANSTPAKSPGKAVTITEFQSSVYVLYNSSNSTSVKVKNTGDVGLSVSFEVTDLNPAINKSVKPPEALTLNTSNEVAYNITFGIGADVDIGEYSGKLKAYSGDIADTKDFKVVILPTESKKSEINVSHSNITEAVDKLAKRLDDITAKGCFSFINVTRVVKAVRENVTGNQTPKMVNVTEEIKTNITANITVEQVDTKIKEMRAGLEKARTAISETRFLDAKKEMEAVKTNIPAAESNMNDLEAFQQLCLKNRGLMFSDASFIMAVAIAVIAGGLIYYYKPRGFRKEKGWIKPISFKPHVAIGKLLVKIGTRMEGKNLKHKLRSKVKKRKGFRFSGK